MTQEEKAKAYDEAIRKLRGMMPNWERLSYNGKTFLQDIVSIFPELKGNEYESTRKRIISLVNAHGQGRFKESMLAWLEKLKVFTEYGDGLYHFANSEFTYVGNPTWDNVSFLEKQGEQKPFDYENATIVQKDFAPKEEPRFNIGDWIVSDKPYINNYYRLCKVVGISDGYYTIQTLDGWKGYNTFKEWESDYHLWSIKDAKKGDVLSSELCGTIMLYKGIEDNNIQFYCDYDFSDIDVPGARFAINNGQHYGSVDDFDDWHPATKEQRDLLFQKMHEAGYTFDFESKELKKIEQKPALDIEIPFGAKDSELQEATYLIPEGFHAEIKDNEVLIKKGKQKPAELHKEDEQNLNACLGYIPDEFLRKWLTGTIHAKYDKPAWSEEDERNLKCIMKIIKEKAFADYDVDDDNNILGIYGMLETWLKSIKQRIGGSYEHF